VVLKRLQQFEVITGRLSRIQHNPVLWEYAIQVTLHITESSMVFIGKLPWAMVSSQVGPATC
jgi:hypothetical protein